MIEKDDTERIKSWSKSPSCWKRLGTVLWPRREIGVKAPDEAAAPDLQDEDAGSGVREPASLGFVMRSP